jgi:hypothetical protein
MFQIITDVFALIDAAQLTDSGGGLTSSQG